MIKSLFGLILIALIFVSSLGVTVYRIKNPDFVSEQVRSVNLYGRLSANLPRLLPDTFVQQAGLSREDIADIVLGAVDSQTFYDFVDKSASAYLTWLSGEAPTLDFRYDLTSLKTRAHEKAVDRLLVKYDDLPVCDAKQIKSWSLDNGLPACKLPTSTIQSNDVASLLGRHVDTILDGLPNELSARENSRLVTARERVLMTLRVVKLAWGITAAFLLFYLLIWRRQAFLSLAFILLVAGLIEAAFSLIAWDWVGRVVIDSLPNHTGQIAPLAIDLVTAVLDVLKHSLSTLSIVLVSTGAGFLLLWIFYRPKAAHPSVVATK